MLIILFLLILANLTYTINGNGGSAIFSKSRECWNEDDIVKLRARKAFEELLPARVHPDQVDGKYIKDMLRYFRRTLRSVEMGKDPHVATLLGEAIADTIGAHLRHDILPTARFAFYAGYLPYRNVRQIHDFFDGMKEMLNTQGLGWKRPERASWSNLTVAKILIGSGALFDPCTCLVTKRDSNSCIHLPIPRLDDDAEPSSIALPFKYGGLVSLTSPNSNNMLLKYYTTAARCILSSSPEKCRHSDFVSFNNDLWNWMKRDVAPHLADEKLYAGYGGVLRIAAAVQTYGKGLSRRNLLQYQDAYRNKWNPLRSLSESYMYVNSDWSPKLYIGVVFMVAVTVYLTLILYNYLCGSNNCKCRGQSESCNLSKEVAYANVESNIPAMLPRQSAYYTNERKRKRITSETKLASLGTARTEQKVYDMNENTEKVMNVMMSEEESASRSMSSSDDEDVEETLVISPPVIETSISQVRVQKTVVKERSRSPMYSTSTVTGAGGMQQASSFSELSVSESSGSRTGSSSTSKSSKSRSSRNLAWARRVISKHSVRSTTKSSTSRTDGNSFTTPP